MGVHILLHESALLTAAESFLAFTVPRVLLARVYDRATGFGVSLKIPFSSGIHLKTELY